MTRIMSREGALSELFTTLFTSDQLRVHLANRYGGELAKELPGVAVSQAQLAFEAVRTLSGRGVIDREFFDDLEVVRPKRTGEIRQVRAQWLDNARLGRGEQWAEGRYELVAPIANGGFGLVWKARDTRSGVIVALKMLLEHHADDRRVRQRFFRGAEVLAKLSHPAIVGVRSSVEQEGLRFYYVMDFIDGDSLDRLVSKRPRAELLAQVLQIGDALGHVHAYDLLHRDIKPRNILVNTKGQAKLIDFDLVTGDNYESITTCAPTTALYAPPEAISSDKKTAAYDVFSLARTVEYVIRGRDPTTKEMADGSVTTLDTSEAIKATLRAALLLDPTERTQSAERFCADLRVALGAVGTPCPPIGPHPTDISSPSPPIPPPSGPTRLAEALVTGLATAAPESRLRRPLRDHHDTVAPGQLAVPTPAPDSSALPESLRLSEREQREVLARLGDHALVDALPLSPRARNILERAGVTLAIEILSLSDTRLRTIRGASSAVAHEIAALRTLWSPLRPAPASAILFPCYRGPNLLVDAAEFPPNITQILEDIGIQDFAALAVTPTTQLATLARRHGFDLAVIRHRLQVLHDFAEASEHALLPVPRAPPHLEIGAESALARQLAAAPAFIARVPEERRAYILRAVNVLVHYHEPVPARAFASIMQVAAHNVGGLVSLLGDDLNTDGEAVIQFDPIGRQVLLSIEHLCEGFNLLDGAK